MSTTQVGSVGISLGINEDYYTISKVESDTKQHYRTLKEATRQRLGRKELTNAEFVQLLLDVYQYHLDYHAK